MEKLFNKYIKHIDLNKPEFNKVTTVHDWRNYVPSVFQENWGNFTHQEKQIIVVMCEIQADKEEWD